MSVYEKVLFWLSSNVSVATKYSELMQIYGDTNDTNLKGYLINYADILNKVSYYKNQGLLQQASNILINGESERNMLISYCNGVLKLR